MQTKPRIAVMVGNTSTAVGVFEGSSDPASSGPQRSLTTLSRQLDLEAIGSQLGGGPLAWYVASVHRGAEEQLRQWVRTVRPQDTYFRLRHADFPLHLAVEYREQVGADRLAGAVAANALRQPDHAAIVVDAGTAITVNAISAHGVFLGGAIMPGQHMRPGPGGADRSVADDRGDRLGYCGAGIGYVYQRGNSQRSLLGRSRCRKPARPRTGQGLGRGGRPVCHGGRHA